MRGALADTAEKSSEVVAVSCDNVNAQGVDA
jgi:hypothetical protein